MTNDYKNPVTDHKGTGARKKQQWEEVYSRGRQNLPWLENPIPIDILNDFLNYLQSNDKILDYGCGDGLLTDYIIQAGFKYILCADIAENALSMVSERHSGVKTVQINEPAEIKDQTFDAILVWGVMHHIDKKFWERFIHGFSNLLKPGGVILLGGHSKKDREFSQGFRVSPTTGEISTAVDYLEEILPKFKLETIKFGYFEFTESFTGSPRAFKYYLLKRI